MGILSLYMVFKAMGMDVTSCGRRVDLEGKGPKTEPWFPPVLRVRKADGPAEETGTEQAGGRRRKKLCFRRQAEKGFWRGRDQLYLMLSRHQARGVWGVTPNFATLPSLAPVASAVLVDGDVG